MDAGIAMRKDKGRSPSTRPQRDDGTAQTLAKHRPSCLIRYLRRGEITPIQCAAGLRFLEHLEQCDPAIPSLLDTDRGGGGIELAMLSVGETMVAARNAVREAMRMLGLISASVLVAVVVNGESAGQWAMELGPSWNGMDELRKALNRLAAHYGLDKRKTQEH